MNEEKEEFDRAMAESIMISIGLTLFVGVGKIFLSLFRSAIRKNK